MSSFWKLFDVLVLFGDTIRIMKSSFWYKHREIIILSSPSPHAHSPKIQRHGTDTIMQFATHHQSPVTHPQLLIMISNKISYKEINQTTKEIAPALNSCTWKIIMPSFFFTLCNKWIIHNNLSSSIINVSLTVQQTQSSTTFTL